MTIGERYRQWETHFFSVKRKKRIQKKFTKQKKELFTKYLSKNHKTLLTVWYFYDLYSSHVSLESFFYSNNPFLDLIKKDEPTHFNGSYCIPVILGEHSMRENTNETT